MPRGITQGQVDQAADALLQAGERATVEKVRAKLGTGSPNTVTRMLDAWRQGLAERLRAANELPRLPDEVGQTMSALWSLATRHARDQLQNEIQSDRARLEQEQAALADREAKQTSTLATMQGDTDRAKEAARLANAKAEALQRLVARLETEIKEQTKERQRLATQNEALLISEAKLRDQINSAEDRSAREREARDQHVRTVEDRAHTQVDRARMDLKALRSDLDEAHRLHHKEEQALQQQIADLTKALSATGREASRQRGIAEALTFKLGAHRGVGGRKPKPRKRAASKRPKGVQ